jgi:hypothetical protein
VGHDGVEIVRVECCAQGFERIPDIAHHTLPQRQGHIGADTKVLHLVELGRQDRRERVLLAVHDAGLERRVDLRERHRLVGGAEVREGLDERSITS